MRTPFLWDDSSSAAALLTYIGYVVVWLSCLKGAAKAAFFVLGVCAWPLCALVCWVAVGCGCMSRKTCVQFLFSSRWPWFVVKEWWGGEGEKKEKKEKKKEEEKEKKKKEEEKALLRRGSLLDLKIQHLSNVAWLDRELARSPESPLAAAWAASRQEAAALLEDMGCKIPVSSTAKSQSPGSAGPSSAAATPAAAAAEEDEDDEDEVVSPTRKSRSHVRPSDIVQVAMTL